MTVMSAPMKCDPLMDHQPLWRWLVGILVVTVVQGYQNISQAVVLWFCND